MTTATYFYGVVANRLKPRVPRTLEGVPRSGPVRVLELDGGLWLVVADVPLDGYGEAALAQVLADLEWVSKAAVAHEAVAEAFLQADAVLPAKLFTIFASDERARLHVTSQRAAIEVLVTRVARKEEWGVRVALGRRPMLSASVSSRTRGTAPDGASYLQRKKAQRDDARTRAQRARAVASGLFDELARHASEARRRPATDLAANGGPLVLDAAFLVTRGDAPRLRAAAAQQARALTSEGFDVALSGPWPPYSFMQD